MTLDDLKKLTRKTVQSAGPRYTPGVKEDAPNLHMQGLERAIAGLAVNLDLKRMLTAAAKSLSDAVGKGSGKSPALKEVAAKVDSAVFLLQQLANQPPNRGRTDVDRLTKNIVELGESLQIESHRLSTSVWEKREQLARIKERRDASDSTVISGFESELWNR